jgi:glutamine amidotransferase
VTVPFVAVVDYGIGNLRSAQKALQRVGADAELTADPATILDADAFVLPGVGAFGRCMEALRGAGLEPVVHEAVATGRPFLGVCIGMQLLFDGSEESPDVPGLGVLPGEVRWIPPGVKRPQIQWNRLDVRQPGDPLLAGLGPAPWMYFNHSLAPVCADDLVLATCDYGTALVAAVRRGNVAATQFHPEKSGRSGLALLEAFVRTAVPAVA